MIPRESDPYPYATAIHEAGHAVIARVLGLSCGKVSIMPESADHHGYAVFDDPRFSWQRGDGRRKNLVDAFCVSLYAGGEAERAVLKSDIIGDRVDCERASACLQWMGVPGASFVGDDVWERYEQRLRRKAVDLVLRHRAKIERVANALLQHRTLQGDEIDALLSD